MPASGPRASPLLSSFLPSLAVRLLFVSSNPVPVRINHRGYTDPGCIVFQPPRTELEIEEVRSTGSCRWVVSDAWRLPRFLFQSPRPLVSAMTNDLSIEQRANREKLTLRYVETKGKLYAKRRKLWREEKSIHEEVSSTIRIQINPYPEISQGQLPSVQITNRLSSHLASTSTRNHLYIRYLFSVRPARRTWLNCSANIGAVTSIRLQAA